MATRERVRREAATARLAAGLLVLLVGSHLAAPAPALAAPRGQGGAAAPFDAAVRVSIDKRSGALSAALNEAPLDAVLEAIRRQTGVAVRAYGPLVRGVTDRFRGLTVEAALRRLLRPFNVVFVYAPGPGGRPGEARLTEVVVYPSGAGQDRGAAPAAARDGAARDGAATRVAAPAEAPAEPAPGTEATAASPRREVTGGVPRDVETRLARVEQDATQSVPQTDRATAASQIEGLLASPDPSVRRRALEAAETTRLASVETLRAAALGDPDVQVRWAALAALVETAGRDAAVAAARDGLSSASPAVRFAALEALGEQLGGEAGEAAARSALNDADPQVRAKAVEIVSIMEEARDLAPEEAAAEEDDPEADEAAEDDPEEEDDAAPPGQSG
jgi:hypothetical protein